MTQYRPLWGVVRSVLHESFSFGAIKAIAGRAGLDPTRLAHLEQRSGSASASKSELLSAMDRQVGEMDEPHVGRFLRIVTEEMVRRQPRVEPDLREALERLGWTFHDGRLLEVTVLDTSDLPELSDVSHADLQKAAIRFRDGDLSGAVSAACAAVDTVTSTVYTSQCLGDPGKASFQEKVKRSLEALDTLGEIERQLTALGWKPKEAEMFARNLRGSLNQAAFVLQSLRSKMGDVHGTKPILKPLVFDAIKLATVIVRLLIRP